jgi:membrane-associated protease RseP (regulator of RpoE activity)
MDFQYVLLAIFIALMLVFIWFERRNIQVNGIFPLLYFAMWRTQRGLKFMDRLAAAAPRFWSLFFGLGIIACFLGMAVISYELIKTTAMLFISPGAAPGIQPVLPFEAKGVFFVPFVYWLISIFVIALVHEFCHGIAARVHRMPVKSAGLAFLGVFVPVVPAAFVEPDERILQKQNAFKQWSVFAAGPFSNLVMAGAVLLLVIFIANPLAEAMLLPSGVRVTDVEEEGPAAKAGMHKGEVITAIDGIQTTYVENLTTWLKTKKPGDAVTLQTNETAYAVTLAPNPKNASQAYLGLFSRQHADIRAEFKEQYGTWSVPVILWSFGLLYWLFLLSIGIGLFNLLPIGPIDGGRMLQLAMQKLFKQQQGQRVWKLISMVFLFLVIMNVVAGFLR